jgi:apolipoprotein N-acyltransferase
VRRPDPQARGDAIAPAPLRRLALRIGGLSRGRRHLLAALLGVLATGALPPLFAVPLLVPAFTGLVWLLDGAATRGRAFWLGWSFGAGFFASGLYWICNALLVDPVRFGWMIPFALFGLGGGLGLFTGAATWLASLPRARGMARVLLLAAAWSALEWLRGHVLTGFPWNLIATTWGLSDLTMQPAAWIGAYGLGLLTVLVAALPAVLADEAPAAARWRAVAAGVLGFALVIGVGAARVPSQATPVVPDVLLRIVQADIAQTLKARRDLMEENLQRHIRLTTGPGFERVTAVIWPETAVPFAIGIDTAHRRALMPAIPAHGLLLTGVVRVERGPGVPFRFFNSLAVLDHAGDIVGTYDKHHLVPFGEYVPFHLRALFDLSKITPGSADFSAGPGPATLAIAGLPPFSPLICYEAIFPEEVVAAGRRPAWLLNVTNDGWFGISSGPHQHFISARFRAVEQGLPLVRAANTGISAVVDPYGRIIAALGLGQWGVIDAPLPVPLSETIYGRFGDLTLAALLLIAAAGAHLMGIRKIGL